MIRFSEADWARMSWHSRQRARKLVAEEVRAGRYAWHPDMAPTMERLAVASVEIERPEPVAVSRKLFTSHAEAMWTAQDWASRYGRRFRVRRTHFGWRAEPVRADSRRPVPHLAREDPQTHTR